MQTQMILSQIPLSEIEQIIRKCVIDAIASTPQAQPAPQSEQTLTIKGLAEYLNVTVCTIQAYKRKRVFPFYQTGRTVFFKKSEVDAAMVSTKKRLS